MSCNSQASASMSLPVRSSIVQQTQTTESSQVGIPSSVPTGELVHGIDWSTVENKIQKWGQLQQLCYLENLIHWHLSAKDDFDEMMADACRFIKEHELFKARGHGSLEDYLATFDVQDGLCLKKVQERKTSVEAAKNRSQTTVLRQWKQWLPENFKHLSNPYELDLHALFEAWNMVLPPRPIRAFWRCLSDVVSLAPRPGIVVVMLKKSARARKCLLGGKSTLSQAPIPVECRGGMLAARRQDGGMDEILLSDLRDALGKLRECGAIRASQTQQQLLARSSLHNSENQGSAWSSSTRRKRGGDMLQDASAPNSKTAKHNNRANPEPGDQSTDDSESDTDPIQRARVRPGATISESERTIHGEERSTIGAMASADKSNSTQASIRSSHAATVNINTNTDTNMNANGEIRNRPSTTINGCVCSDWFLNLARMIEADSSHRPDFQGIQVEQISADGGLFCDIHLRLLSRLWWNLRDDEATCPSAVLVERFRQCCREYMATNGVKKIQEMQPGWFSRSNPREDTIWKHSARDHRIVELQRDSPDWAQILVDITHDSSAQSSWENDGFLIVDNFFRHLTAIEEDIEQEFKLYAHHHAEGVSQRDMLLHNMYFSLVQQLVVQDPLWYLLHVAISNDHAIKLVSYPHPTFCAQMNHDISSSMVRSSDSPDLFLNLNTRHFLKHGEGADWLESSLSLVDESDYNCTVVVKGSHLQVKQWLQDDDNPPNPPSQVCATTCTDLYAEHGDELSQTDVTPLPCSKWAVRVTRADVIYGHRNTTNEVSFGRTSEEASANPERRLIFPCYTRVVDEAHDKLEGKRISWTDLQTCYIGLKGPRYSSSGVPCPPGTTDTFLPNLRLGSCGALGEAILGMRRFDDPLVLQEQDILFRSAHAVRQAYVDQVRAGLLERYKLCIQQLKLAERQHFGDDAFFTST